MSDNASTTKTLAGYTHCWDGGRPVAVEEFDRVLGGAVAELRDALRSYNARG